MRSAGLTRSCVRRGVIELNLARPINAERAGLSCKAGYEAARSAGALKRCEKDPFRDATQAAFGQLLLQN